MKSGGIFSSFLFRPEEGTGPITPTQQASGILIDTKETEQTLTWTRGNGTGGVVVLARQGSVIDANVLVDGTDYSANAIFGAGDEVGALSGIFVVYKGTGTSVTVTGLPSDILFFYDVLEYNSDGFKYLNTIADNTIQEYTAFFFDDQFLHDEGTGDPAGQTDLETNAAAFYDFNNLTFADEATVTDGDTGLTDEGPGANTATVVSTPACNEVTINSGTRKAVRNSSSTGINSNSTFNSTFQNASGFEVHWSGQISDGISGSAGQYMAICGVLSGNNSRLLIRIFGADGRAEIQFRDGTQTTTTVWRSTDPVVVDGVNTFVLQARLDFAADAFSLWINNSVVTGSVVSGPAVSALDPSIAFNSTHNLYLGSYNSFGSLTGNDTGATISTVRFAVTPLRTAQQRADIHDFFAFTASGSSFTLNGYTLNQDVGYSIDVVANEIILGGSPEGWGDNIVRDTVIDADLEEVAIEARIRLIGDPTTVGGIGVGLRNNVASEANHSAIVEFNTDTDYVHFGKARILTGTGSVGAASMTGSANSSGNFTPVNGDRYILRITRDIQNNDCLYVGTVYDVTDTGGVITDESPNQSTSHISIGRPLSTFFGSTTKAWIHFSAGDFAVEYFKIVRIGTETAPPPVPTNYDIYVATNGSDLAAGTESAPVLTIQRGIELIQALGGSDRSLSISAGTYTLTSPLSIPTNLGPMDGAGIDLTVVQGASNLDGVFNYVADFSAMVRASSAGSTAVTHYFKNFKLVGGSDAARQKPWGLTIKNRHGVTIENVSFEYFNTGGLNIDNCNDPTLINPRFIATSGSQGPANNEPVRQNPATGWPYTFSWTTPPVFNQFGYSMGALTLRGSVDNLEWSGGSYEGLRFGNGYGVKSLGGDVGTAVMTNHNYHGLTISQNPSSSGSTGNNFFLEYHGSSPTTFGEFDFHDNIITIGGALSIVPTTSNDNDHRVYDNYVSLSDGFFIEGNTHRLKLYNNYITSTANGNAPVFISTTTGLYQNHHYHHNVIEFLTSSVSTGVLNSRCGHSGLIIEHNTVVFLSTGGANICLLQSNFNGGGTTATFRNNAFVGDNPGGSNLFSTPSNYFSSALVQNNFATHLNTQYTQSGVTGGAGQGNQTGLNASGWFTYAGAKPAPYYNRAPGSALTGAGTSGSNIGAL